MPTHCGFGALVEVDESGFSRAGINQDQLPANGMSCGMKFRVADPVRAGDDGLAVEVREVLKVDRLNLLHMAFTSFLRCSSMTAMDFVKRAAVLRFTAENRVPIVPGR